MWSLSFSLIHLLHKRFPYNTMAAFVHKDVALSLLKKLFLTLRDKELSIQGDQSHILTYYNLVREVSFVILLPIGIKRTEWLSGSVEHNKLYCWPCLLFISEKGVWKQTGYKDLNNLSKSSKKRASTGTYPCHDLVEDIRQEAYRFPNRQSKTKVHRASQCES